MSEPNIDKVREAVASLRLSDKVTWEIIRDRDDTGTCIYSSWTHDDKYIKTYSWISDYHRDNWLTELVNVHVHEFCHAVGRFMVTGETP